MFNFFIKKDDKSFGVDLAKEAKIETLYEFGKIIGFLIFLKGNAKTIRNKIDNSEAGINFIATIEERILSKEYKDTRPTSMDSYIEYIPPIDDGASLAKRAVLTTNKEPLFYWHPNDLGPI